jgi:Tfp pilus assembly protein PilO
MTIAMERILAWKLLPRVVMAVMLWQYVVVLDWFMSLPQDTVSTQATALTATVTGAISGAFAVWLGSEK